MEVIQIPTLAMRGLEHYKTEDVAKFMSNVAPTLLKQFQDKDVNYGGSWQEDGIMSVHFNLKRKWSRWNTQFKKGQLYLETNENVGDTITDLATYSMMTLYFMSRTNPSVEVWLRQLLYKYHGLQPFKPGTDIPDYEKMNLYE